MAANSSIPDRFTCKDHAAVEELRFCGASTPSRKTWGGPLERQENFALRCIQGQIGTKAGFQSLVVIIKKVPSWTTRCTLEKFLSPPWKRPAGCSTRAPWHTTSPMIGGRRIYPDVTINPDSNVLTVDWDDPQNPPNPKKQVVPRAHKTETLSWPWTI